MDTVQFYLNKIDGELEKLPPQMRVKQIEKTTGVPKKYMAAGLIGAVVLMLFFNIAGPLIVRVVGFTNPAFASFKALETKKTSDDKQWLTYWVIFASLMTLDVVSGWLLYWFPFYYLFVVVAILYLQLPQFKGAEVVYVRFLRQFLLENENKVDSAVNKAKNTVQDELQKDL